MKSNQIPTNNDICRIPDIIDIDPENRKSIDEYLDQYDKVSNETAVIRQQLMKKLADVVEHTCINTNEDDLDTVTKKIMVVESLSKLLDGREKSMASRINLRQKNQIADATTSLSNLAAEVLKRIDVSSELKKTAGCAAPDQEAYSKLDEIASTFSKDIPDTALRDDPFDFSCDETDESNLELLT